MGFEDQPAKKLDLYFVFFIFFPVDQIKESKEWDMRNSLRSINV